MEIWLAISGFIGAVIGAAAAVLTTQLQLRHQLRLAQEERKTDEQAELIAKKLLSHEKLFERSFEALSTAIGGFEEDELRKLLVRAGAIRTRRKDGSEWWGLLDKEIDRINAARKKENRPDYVPNQS